MCLDERIPNLVLKIWFDNWSIECNKGPSPRNKILQEKVFSIFLHMCSGYQSHIYGTYRSLLDVTNPKIWWQLQSNFLFSIHCKLVDLGPCCIQECINEVQRCWPCELVRLSPPVARDTSSGHTEVRAAGTWILRAWHYRECKVYPEQQPALASTIRSAMVSFMCESCH